MINFKRGKEKIPIIDPLTIQKTKSENEYKNLKIFFENMKIKELF